MDYRFFKNWRMAMAMKHQVKPEGGEWDLASIGDLRGKSVIVTGANSGIGFHALWKASEKLTGVIFDLAHDVRATA
jgi:hypothetical protein